MPPVVPSHHANLSLYKFVFEVAHLTGCLFSLAHQLPTNVPYRCPLFLTKMEASLEYEARGSNLHHSAMCSTAAAAGSHNSTRQLRISHRKRIQLERTPRSSSCLD